MEFNSLLNNYGYVVYGNEKVLKKSEKYFSSDEKKIVENLLIFFENQHFRGLVDFQKKMCQNFPTENFSSLEKIFFGKLFSKLLYFRKLHVHSFPISYRTPSTVLSLG